MALAPYFSKNALAIQHVLKKGSFDEFESLLNLQVVEIAFDETVVKHESKCCVDLLIKLLARLYPKLKIRPLHSSGNKIAAECIQQARQINSLIEIVDAPATVSIVIGNTPLPADDATSVFYIGSNHWDVLLSCKSPVGSGDSHLPFAAGTAACIGAANIFRFVFASLMRKQALDDEVNFTLLEPYEQVSDAIKCDDLGSFHLAGLGAIGSGCLWSLSSLTGVRGEMFAIDYQKISLTNIQRYVETFERDEKVHKTIIAARSLKHTSIIVRKVNDTWNGFISKSKNYRKEVVLTALDTAKDRTSVQASLPRIIFNGYTDDGILGVSRHVDFLDDACINCMYTPKEPAPSMSQLIANDLGIPELKIRDLIYLNSKVDDQLLELIAKANSISFDAIKKFKGVPIQTFYSEFICGGVLLKIKGSTPTSTQTVEAPLAFQSALAGILLIADLYLYKAGVKLNCNRTHYNPLAPIKPGINFTHHTLAKDKSGRCICCDAVYRDSYRKKWVDEVQLELTFRS